MLYIYYPSHQPGFKSFHSWVYRWDSSATIWFIMVEEDGFPFLQLRAGKNGASESNFHSMTAVGRKSLEMGGLAREAGFNISDIICAPSVKCIVAAAFQRGKKDEIKGLNIKIDGAFSSTTEGYYLHKQFRSLAAERGYNVDETYKTSVKCCGKCKVDRYVNLECRLAAAVQFLKEKYSGMEQNAVVVFVDKSLKSVLTDGYSTNDIFALHSISRCLRRKTINKGIKTAGTEIFVSMLDPDFDRFDSLVCSWNSCQKLWFILVDDGNYLASRLGLEEKKPDSSSGPSMASIESKSRYMGVASGNARHNITNVISAPNFKCITAAAGFIRGYEDAVKVIEKSLTIKIDGGFAETYVAFNLQDQFRSLAIENGYRVDETYESSAPFPVEYHLHPHLQLEKRLATTMESMKEKFAGACDNIVVVFVHDSLKSDLKSIDDKIPKPLEQHVDIPPRYVGKVGRQSQGSSGPIMTGIESSSVLMGAEIVEMPYNVTNVISAPNFKCLAAAAAFISGYQGPVKVGQNALNIKIDGGLSLTNAAFEMHEKFQSLVAESGYNIDKTYKTVAEFSEESSLETRVEATLESLRKTFPGTWKDAVAIFVEKPLQIVLEIITINDPVPSEIYAVTGRLASVQDDDDDDDDE
ncbi:hypothetical protein T03_8164 [Trichinella britovi]|uniref:Uncharacterized protein n=1 Tax=Trichinella britovi TaxID=45882 RepID=A0A0V1CI65_TRIBR|nr:hypothetical protein T03_8164 [Trichinella britovi]